MEIISKFLEKNGIVFTFLVVSLIIYFSELISVKATNKKIPGSAIAIIFGLLMAYFGGVATGGEKGIADIKIFSGFGVLVVQCFVTSPLLPQQWEQVLS